MTVLVPAVSSASTVEGDDVLTPVRLLPGFDHPDRRFELAKAAKFTAYSGKHDLGYYLTDTDPVAQYAFNSIVAMDVNTGAAVTSKRLSPPALYTKMYAAGQPHTMAVDATGERLFVAYGIPGPDAAAARNQPLAADGRRACVTPANYVVVLDFHCLGGVHVLDAGTLEPIGRIPVDTIRIEGVPLSGVLRAMSYAPSVGDPGQPDKLLLVVEDIITSAVDASQRESPRYQVANPTYLVQLDLSKGTHDWTLRLEACRGPREVAETGDNGNDLQRPYPSVVFRSADGGAIFAACHGKSQAATIIRVPLDASGAPAALPVAVGEFHPPAADEEATPPDGGPRLADTPVAFQGPERTMQYLADPASGRILMQVIDGSPRAEVWWVFDTSRWQMAGTIGVGPYTKNNPSVAGLDTVRGRLYVLGPAVEHMDFDGGLFMADIRRTPLPQALTFPQFAEVPTTLHFHLDVLAAPTGDRARILVREFLIPQEGSVNRFSVILDEVPVTADTDVSDYSNRTLDLDEAPGVTDVSYDGAARGFGARALLAGGGEAALRLGPIDPIGQGLATNDWLLRDERGDNSDGQVHRQLTGAGADMRSVTRGLGMPWESPCTTANREVVLGMVGVEGPAVVDGSGGRASAEPVVMDASLHTDKGNPVSRCAPVDWSELWSTGLFGSPPAEEPTLDWALRPGEAECVSNSDQPTVSFQDPVVSSMASQVSCGDDEVSGYGYIRGIELPGVTVGEASSTFRTYVDPVRGIVARVESVARLIDVTGLLRIASVRAVAESWANGRKQPVAVGDRDPAYRPNCDSERTAGTCFRRHIFGLTTPGYSCGPCGDEARLLEGLNKALGANGKAEFREPDGALAAGSENGFIAAIQKQDGERFADLVMNGDLLQTMLPALEITRFAAPNRTIGGGGPRGRQIYQFAGVQVSSSYGISCLLVYDEATNTCAAAAETPGSIQVSLSDMDGKPLAGGAFEVRADVDADGVLGLKDTLLPDGACVTAEDGIGTCTFDNLQPGTYLVSQVAAPPGYAKSAEPWVSEVASGEQRTVAFTNVSNVSTIDLTATDENGAPISGATFAAYPDPDSDGKVAPDAQPAAECTTDAQGACQMKVPAGSYVLVQTSAPGGLEGIEPVPFTFASGGQVASVTVVNYPPAAPEQPAPAAAPIDYSPPVDYAPPVESVSDFTPVADTPVIEEPTVSVPDRIGGTVTQVIRAPGDALRLLARDPKQAVAWTAALALFCLAAMAVRRRQQAMALIHL